MWRKLKIFHIFSFENKIVKGQNTVQAKNWKIFNFFSKTPHYCAKFCFWVSPVIQNLILRTFLLNKQKILCSKNDQKKAIIESLLYKNSVFLNSDRETKKWCLLTHLKMCIQIKMCDIKEKIEKNWWKQTPKWVNMKNYFSDHTVSL